MSLPNGHAPLGAGLISDRFDRRKCTEQPDCGCWVCLEYVYPKREDRKSGATKRQTDESLVAERLSPFEYDRISSCSQKLVGIQE